MSTLRNFGLIWSLRAAGILALAFMLVVSSFTPVFAEEREESSSEESAPEEPAPEEPAPEEPAPEGGYVLNGEVVSPDEYGYVPPPEAFEGDGAWARVDVATGEVLHVCACPGRVNAWDSWRAGAGGAVPPGTAMRFQARATPDGNVAGWGDATFDQSSGRFRVDNGQSSFEIVPENTSRNADGTGRSYNIGSGIVDITTDNTFRSGDTSANVRTYRSDYQDSTVDVSLGLPDLGENGSLLTYETETRTSESSERPSALDQISLDVDSLLMENGYVATDITIDEETGEETTTQIVDSENTFVVAIREVTQSVVEFLSSLLGFGRD